MFSIELSADDRRLVDELLSDIAGRHPDAAAAELVDELAVYCDELPRSLRSQANHFRLHEPSGVCLVRGFEVHDDVIGNTPARWSGAGSAGSPTHREDLFLLLVGSLMGDPIAWSTQQDGNLLHDVIPIEGHEEEQINSSTSAELTWHTEDAFHPLRADYVALLCLRNPDGAETTFANFDDLALPPETVATLAEPRYTIRPDESHLPKNRTGTAPIGISLDLLERSYEWVADMSAAPPLVPVLFGDPSRPYGRLDPFFMDPPEDDDARTAFDELLGAVGSALRGVVLAPGDVLLIDNYKAVHGRRPFRARFDGRDRWLRRINVTRDLRRSRDSRMSAAARVIV